MDRKKGEKKTRVRGAENPPPPPKKKYNIHNTANAWNQEQLFLPVPITQRK